MSTPNPNRTLIALAVLGVAVLARAQDDEWARPWPKGAGITAQDIIRLSNEQRDMAKQGLEEEKRGDYAAAERDLRRACVFMGHDDLPRHLLLAYLFDRTGDGRKAYVEYRTVVVGDGHSLSSYQSNSVILARFGDLCAQYGTLDDARHAYDLAIANGPQHFEMQAYARNDALNVLRSAAHTAAAIEHLSTANFARFGDEIEIAVAADDKNWVARAYRAQVYRGLKRPADATREAMIAEGMAPDWGKAQVRAFRYGHRIVDADGHLPPMPTPPKPTDPAPKKG